METLKEIKEKFDKVIEYSQGIDGPITDELLKKWYEAKHLFIKAFGGELIYQLPDKVQFELNDKAKHARISNFIGLLYDNYGFTDLANFVEQQEEGFYKNLTVSDYTTRNGKNIKKGTKLVKAFKHFITNESVLENIQNEASRLIQEDKIEGYLCVSVHPLDFLSSSETTYKWRSCHSLDGEYRAGNLSYMLDSSTCICYLKTEDNAVLPNFPEDVRWNSKKWRVLMFFSDNYDLLFAGKQYPFDTTTGIDLVLNKLLPNANLLEREKWTDWNNSYFPTLKISDDKEIEGHLGYAYIGNGLVKLKKIVVDIKKSKHYNDLLYSSTYRPIYAQKIYKPYWFPEMVETVTSEEETKVHIGSDVKCLKCGADTILTASDTMMCESCEREYGESDAFYTCEVCGQRVHEDNVYAINDGIIVCPDCYNDSTIVCCECEESFLRDDIYYLEETEEYLCKYCVRDRGVDV